MQTATSAECETCGASFDHGWVGRIPRWCPPCRRARERAAQRDGEYQQRYGITTEQYDAMAEAQDYRCAICGEPPTRRRLDVDHDHKTGVVRGLLCSDCNIALGKLRDDPDRLKAAIDYLAHWKGAPPPPVLALPD